MTPTSVWARAGDTASAKDIAQRQAKTRMCCALDSPSQETITSGSAASSPVLYRASSFCVFPQNGSVGESKPRRSCFKASIPAVPTGADALRWQNSSPVRSRRFQVESATTRGPKHEGPGDVGAPQPHWRHPRVRSPVHPPGVTTCAKPRSPRSSTPSPAPYCWRWRWPPAVRAHATPLPLRPGPRPNSKPRPPAAAGLPRSPALPRSCTWRRLPRRRPPRRR